MSEMAPVGFPTIHFCIYVWDVALIWAALNMLTIRFFPERKHEFCLT